MICIMAALSLYGCAPGERTSVVTLPEKESGGELGINIKNIQEYTYDGHSESNVFIAWGWPGSGLVYILKLEERGYVYYKMDVQKKEVLDSTLVDERDIGDVKIAPGGCYISYEVLTGIDDDNIEGQHILFCAETGVSKVLKKWNAADEVYSYVWSDDGTKLFSWQMGDNYKEGSPESNDEWTVTRYDVDNAQIEKAEFTLESSGYGWRSVLPNADGSEIYVREEHEDYVAGGLGAEKGGAADDRVNIETEEGSEDPSPDRGARNWMLIPASMKVKKLKEYSGEAVYPVKYTKEGLFVQDIEGNQLLVDHMEGDPVKNELFRTDNLEVYICENGDHIFLLEWINNMSCFQITGIKVENGQAKARQVLYKSAVGDEVDKVAILDDRMMVIQGSRYSEESDAYSFKSTTLEY